jgi:ubiquinone biosynthesis protein
MRFLAIALTAVLIVITVVAIVGGFALRARRLLGLRFGLVRLLLAGLLGFAVAGPIAQSLAGAVPTTERAITPLWFLILAGACALVVAMVFLVVAEALVPSGSLPGPLEWRRELRGRIARARRYSQISRIAIRHGLGPYLRGRRRAELEAPGGRARLARSVRQALDGGGVTFVKLGQVLSTRPDLLPLELVEELGRLRDQAAPAPWPEVERVLAAELGGPPEEVFARFDRRPLAAASVAQVHAARLPSGAEVVVKVQRPGIRSVVERDLDIVARLARTVEARSRWGRSIGTRELASAFAGAVREELDFRIEAGNLAAVAAAAGAAADGGVRVPTPHESLCTARVLVMQRLEGTPLAMAEPVIAERGLDRDALARTLLEFLLRQIVLDGVFHADPIPATSCCWPTGGWGCWTSARSAGWTRRCGGAAAAAAGAGPRRPARRQRRAAGGDAAADEVDQERLERALGQFMARYLGPVADYGLSVPPEVAAVFRALATLEGTLAQLAPGFDLVAEARSLAGHYAAGQLEVASARQAVGEELTTLLPMLRRLPRRLERIASAAEHGRLSVHVRLFADERDRRHGTGLLHQVLLTILAATAGIMAVLLLGTAGGPRVTAAVGLYQLLGYNLLVVCAILALRVLVLIFRPDR